MQKNIVVATIKSWNLSQFEKWIPPTGYKKYLISNKNKLNNASLKRLNPKYVFFIHWSWIIPKEIYQNYNCIVFHMTDLPFGRGGSPLQNLLVRGIYKTKLSALKVTSGIDSGPIYLKKNLNISRGSAQEIFSKASLIDFKMIDEIIKRNLEPKEQKGKVVAFKRRVATQSKIPSGLNRRQLYDFIRMLDAEDYPKAFLSLDGFKYEFSNAELKSSGVQAKVLITK